jgi:Flp pilus assembly pilin Flp
VLIIVNLRSLYIHRKVVKYREYPEKKGGNVMEKIIRFLKDEEGLESVEYALLGVLIALGIIGGVTTLAGWIDGTFTTISTTVP